MTPDHAVVDAVLYDALRSASAGVDLDIAERAIQQALEALLKQAQALNATRYRTHTVLARCGACKAMTRHTINAPRPDEVARAASHTAKVVDGIARLAQFAKGQPDSRPDMGGDWLRALDDDQLRIVQGMVAANAAKQERK